MVPCLPLSRLALSADDRRAIRKGVHRLVSRGGVRPDDQGSADWYGVDDDVRLEAADLGVELAAAGDQHQLFGSG
jgi:hypothetical protein